MMLSSTLMWWNSARFWKVRPMPSAGPVRADDREQLAIVDAEIYFGQRADATKAQRYPAHFQTVSHLFPPDTALGALFISLQSTNPILHRPLSLSHPTNDASFSRRLPHRCVVTPHPYSALARALGSSSRPTVVSRGVALNRAKR